MLRLATFAAVLAFGAAAASSALPVNTTNGLITGHRASNISSVFEFLGIPYAQPPIGAFRFAPPRPYNGSSSYVAASYGYDCPYTPNGAVGFPDFTPQAQRVINYFSANTGTTQSEDCLTLNVWTPLDTVTCAELPVLIFFYGGRFTYGHTNSPFFDGEFLARSQHVVVVTVNFRDNIFGFPGAPGIVQNAGMRDRRLAVEWMQKNAGSFGGNSSLMALFGQSAGGVAIDYYAYAYSQNPIVSGIISESGNALSFPLNTVNATLENWYNVTKTLGCGASLGSFACMLTKNWTEIRDAAAKAPSASSGNPLRSIPAFYPTPDNETIFANYTAMSNAGQFAKLPYLLGNNNFEQGYYALPDYKKNITVTVPQGDDFLLNSFTCPNAYQAAARADHGVPVWLYRYFGDWPNIRLYNANNASYSNQVIGQGSGAYHGSELEMVFGNPSGVSGIANSHDENVMIHLMQTAWAAFARDPQRGLSKLGWPRYGSNNRSLVRLAYDNRPTAEFVDPMLYNAACANYTPTG